MALVLASGAAGALPGPGAAATTGAAEATGGPASAVSAVSVRGLEPDPSPTVEPEDGGGAGTPESAESTTPTPLTVELSSMNPATIPANGPVVLTGSVRNDSEELWQDVNMIAFLGSTALTTDEEVVAAVATPESVMVGNRLDLEGTFQGVGDLLPGAEQDFTVRIPQQALPDTEVAGAYWIGVHALGTNALGRDAVADGRYRTLIPTLPEDLDSPQVPVSVVVPLRQPALRDDTGRLLAPEQWVGAVGSRLTRLAEFAGSASESPLTWLVDPAVLDALQDVGEGNPPLDLGPGERLAPDEEPTAGPEEDPTASPTATPEADPPSEPPSEDGSGTPEEPPPSTPTGSPDGAQDPEIAEDGLPDPGQAAAARALVQRLTGLVAGGTALALPYADTDVVALARQRPDLLERATTLSEQRLGDRGLVATPAVAPPDGLLDLEVTTQALPRLPATTQLLISDRGREELPAALRLQVPTDGPDGPEGHPLVLTDAQTSAGGPGPSDPTAPLALRQRILVDAALESLRAEQSGSDPRPVVVALAAGYDPGSDWARAAFFDSLQTPWSSLAELPSAPVTDPESTVEPADQAADRLPGYPRSARAAEVRSRQVEAASLLVGRATRVTELLANRNDVQRQLTGAALQTTSYGARARPRLSVQSANELVAATDGVLAGVEAFGTEFVTLSGGAGTLTVTLVNGLEQPVTVGVEVVSAGAVRAESPEPVELGPQQRATLRVPVTSREGVFDVAFQPVTRNGGSVGRPFEFVLRTSQVDRVVWAVMAGGALVFLVALLRRVRQQLGTRRARIDAGEVR